MIWNEVSNIFNLVPLPPVLATFIAYNACVGFDFTYGDVVGRVLFIV